MEAVFSSPCVLSLQWIPTSLQILQMATVVMVPSWRLGLLRFASGSRGDCHHDIRHPWPLARRQDSICSSAASRAKSATSVLGFVLTRCHMASTDGGRNEALSLHELECRRLQGGTLSGKPPLGNDSRRRVQCCPWLESHHAIERPECKQSKMKKNLGRAATSFFFFFEKSFSNKTGP